MRPPSRFKQPAAVLGTLALSASLLASTVVGPFADQPSATASSHREAPQISQDPAADITDVYVFRSPDRPDTVTAIMNVWPFQLPGGGPTWYLFDPGVRYSMHFTNDGDADDEIRIDFRFRTEFRPGNPLITPGVTGGTTANSAVYNDGPINQLGDPNQIIMEFWTGTLVNLTTGQSTVLFDNLPTAPHFTGERSFPTGYDAVANRAILDMTGLPGGRLFAGPRDDPFFIDLGATFDLLRIRPGPPGNQGGGVDQLAGLNVLTMAIQVPITAITRPGCNPNLANDIRCVVGLYTTTSRQSTRVLRPGQTPALSGDMVQVARLSAPLVNELFVPYAQGQKDLFNASDPNNDDAFVPIFQNPQIALLLTDSNGLPRPPLPRVDLLDIYLNKIPDLNRPEQVEPAEIAHVNLATPLTANPNRLGLLGGDRQGFPNGRRLADDVVDITLRAAAGGTPFTPSTNRAPANLLGDGIDQNDRPFLPSFPYMAPPLPGPDAGGVNPDAPVPSFEETRSNSSTNPNRGNSNANDNSGR